MSAKIKDVWGSTSVTDAVFVQVGDRHISYTQSAANKIKNDTIGNEEFIVEKPVVSDKINASVFGLSEGATATENADALQKAVDYCRMNNISALELNKGIYKVVRENAVVLDFKNMKDFTITGNGAKLVFCETQNKYQNGKFFCFKDCSRIQIKDLIIDWDWETFPLFMIGKVTDVSGNKVIVTSDKFKIPDFVSVYGTKGWDYEYDCVSANKEALPQGATQIVKTGTYSLEFTYKDKPQNVKKGQAVQMAFKPKMNANGIYLENCTNVTFDNLEINAVPYTAIYSTGGEYLEINNCRIVPGEGRRFSTYGGNEIHCTKGHFKFTKNTTRGILDDNLHFSNGYLGGGIKKIDDHTIEAMKLTHYSVAPLIYNGAVMEVRNNEYAPKNWKGKITNFVWNFNKYPNTPAPHTCTITFDKKLPVNLAETDYLFNADFEGGQFIIEDNEMYGGLCHGIYGGMSNGVIRNNRIENFGYPGLILNCVKRWGKWFIGNPLENVIVSGNILKNTNLNKRDPASLFVGAGYDNAPTDYYPAKYYAVQNVLIEDNIIENSGLIAMGTWSSRNILFRNNKIINPNLFENKERFRGYGRMYATDCDNVIFEGNKVEITAPVFGEDGIFIKNAKDVYADGERKE